MYTILITRCEMCVLHIYIYKVKFNMYFHTDQSIGFLCCLCVYVLYRCEHVLGHQWWWENSLAMVEHSFSFNSVIIDLQRLDFNVPWNTTDVIMMYCIVRNIRNTWLEHILYETRKTNGNSLISVYIIQLGVNEAFNN